MINDQHYLRYAAISFLCILMFCTFNTTIFAQCNINSCSSIPVATASAPVFNINNRSIDIDNVTFGNIGCNENNFIVGIDLYVYQLLPNGNQVRNCNVLNPIPNNILGVVHLDLGASSICNQNFNIGKVSIGENEGFEICDGGRYQIELALYATTNLNFRSLNKTVDSELSSSEYKLFNLGTVETNITNTFANGQPVISTEISNWTTRSDNTIVVPCNQDVNLYVQGQSVLADCAPFGDFSNAIPSEMVNTFTYSVNGGTPVIIEDSSSGASGGQLSGAISSVNSACYGGIITNINPYVFDASTLANACGGTSVKFTINTQDAFTGESKTADYTVIFDSCVPTLTLNNTNLNNPVYAAAQNVNSTGAIANNSNVVFQAGTQVCLNNGFTAPLGAEFAAEIAACQ